MLLYLLIYAKAPQELALENKRKKYWILPDGLVRMLLDLLLKPYAINSAKVQPKNHRRHTLQMSLLSQQKNKIKQKWERLSKRRSSSLNDRQVSNSVGDMVSMLIHFYHNQRIAPYKSNIPRSYLYKHDL